MEKILFFTSQKSSYPELEEGLKKYQSQIVKYIPKNSTKVILEFQPQTIVFDEFIDVKEVRKIVRRFPFVPVSVIGELNDPKTLERFLSLGINTIKVPVSQKEIEKIFSNILWFSLSKPQLWEEELKLVDVEKKNKFLSIGMKVGVVMVVVFFSLVVANNIYFSYVEKKSENKFLLEVPLPYPTPSDISFLNGNYLISDWSIKNIFLHDNKSDNMVNMFVPENKFNSISIYRQGNEIYVFTSSVFANKIYVYRYPDFDSPVKEIIPIGKTTIMSLDVEDDTLFVLDNNRVIYELKLEEEFNWVLVSSFSITAFFPVDIWVYNRNLFVLDEENVVHKFSYPEMIETTRIDFSHFFGKDKSFVSFGIDNNWFYLLNEKEKKLYKITRKVLS